MIDPAALAHVDPDVAPLLTALDARDDEIAGEFPAIYGRLDSVEDRVAALEDGDVPPPDPVAPPTPTPADVRIVVNAREVLISVTSPTATMARFDVDPGATVEEPNLSHVRTLDPGSYFAQVACGNPFGWSEQSEQIPFTIADDEPPPTPTYKDRVTPLLLSAASSEADRFWWRFHDLAPNTTALQIQGSGWEVGHLLLERIAQGIFWADAGWLHDVDIWNFGRGGAGTSGQAHAVYGRSGLVERVRVHSKDPTAPNGSSAFHAHRQDGPVVGLTWRLCENHSGADSILAGYRAGLAENTIDGFIQSSGKLRIGVAGQANGGDNRFDGIDAAVLQIDGNSWGGDTRFAGRVRALVHAGGLSETVDQMADRYPNVDFTDLVVTGS